MSNQLEYFLEVEREFALYDKEILGCNYWIYSRFYIWGEVQKRMYELGNAHSNSVGNKRKLKLFLQLFYNSFVRKQPIKKGVDILFYNHPRKVLDDGYYKCCYTSDIASKIENSLILERPEPYEHKMPSREKNICYLDRITVCSNLYYYIYKKLIPSSYRKLKEAVLNDIKVPIEKIGQAYNIELNANKVADLVIKKILVYKYKVGKIRGLLEKINPRMIVQVVSYHMDCMILNEIAKERCIPSVELQHGVMGKKHVAYNYQEDVNVKQFPDYVFVFSEYWKDTSTLPIEKSKIKVVGFPHFETQKAKYVRMEEKKGIVFISQGTIGKRLSQLAVELSKKVDSSNWKIYYKLHPGEYSIWEKEYPWLKEALLEVVASEGMNLYEIFANCDVQIGVYSTALYEGMGFGLTTLIYKDYFSDMFEDLCNAGYARFVESADECMELLVDDVGREKNNFWKENSLENMHQELKMILSESEKNAK